MTHPTPPRGAAPTPGAIPHQRSNLPTSGAGPASNVISIHTARPLPCDYAEPRRFISHEPIRFDATVDDSECVEDMATERLWQFAAKVCGVLAIVTLIVGCIAALGGWQ
jgi:hypothetical protein